MHEEREPSHLDLDEEKPLPSSGDMGDDRALSLVNQTFDHYEKYRSRNHDKRWRKIDQLYFGLVPQKFWEGSKVPRASFSTFIAWDQVQAAYPLVVNALFGTAGDWFQVEPMKGTTVQEAQDQKDALMYVLENPTHKFGTTGVQEIEQAALSLLQYGNGALTIEFDAETNLPVVEYRDMRDLYLDPACTSPNIEGCRSVCTRLLKTVRDLDDLRGTEDMNIPPKDVLIQMARYRSETDGDTSVQFADANHGIDHSNADEHLPEPVDRYVELRVYTSKSRIIWVLDRTHVAYNQPNPWGFIPGVVAPCFTVLKRIYGMSLVEIMEDTQLYSDALYNLHLDWINLSLNAPMTKKRGNPLSPSQLKVRPGVIREVDNPKEDFVATPPPAVLTNVFQDLSFLQSKAESRSGINSMVTAGVPMRSNASRTKAGIDAQMSGPMSRLQPVISNIENYLIVPLLYKLQAMLDKISEGQETFDITDAQGQMRSIPTGVFKKPVRFKMLAASKMLTRERLAGMFQFVAQNLMSGPFMAETAKNQSKINFPELWRMMQEATGIAKAYELIVPMTPEEVQAMQAPPPQVQAHMAMRERELGTRLQIMKTKTDADMQKAALSYKQKEEDRGEKSAIEVTKLLVNDAKKNGQPTNGGAAKRTESEPQ